LISIKPGIKAKDISTALGNRPIKTIERQIKELVTLDLVKRIGSRKTGGYHRVKKM
jgi:predicted HTH transcriptional regulator